eukprot:2330232-Pyramimonas_sp.AAC.1
MGASATNNIGITLTGADRNVEPQALDISGFARRAGLIAVVPARPTCAMPNSTSAIDYAPGPHDLARLVERVKVVNAWHSGLHKP